MNIFKSDEHPNNITIFTDVMVEVLDKGYQNLEGLNKALFDKVVKEGENVNLGNAYTEEVYKRFYTSLKNALPDTTDIKIEWVINEKFSKFFINGLRLKPKNS